MPKQRRLILAETLEPRLLMSSYALTSLLSGRLAEEINTTGVVADSSGNVYGSTSGVNGGGTVFELAAGTHKMTTLATFNAAEGSVGGLIIDSAGNIYGATSTGGSASPISSTVFEITAGAHQLETVATIPTTDGVSPGSLVMDSSGNIYGLTQPSSQFEDNETLFKISAETHQFSVLTTFGNSGTGSPYQVLAVDGAGNIFGIAVALGQVGIEGFPLESVVYELPAGSNTLQVLGTIANSEANQFNPGLVVDSQGNIYGTTAAGGYGFDGSDSGDGTVFEIAAGSHLFSVIAQFNGSDGKNPNGGLAIDSNGDLFGTTLGEGGSDGTFFEVSAGTHVLTTIASFNGSNGADPAGSLFIDANGNLYGTTSQGPDGTVFELSPATIAQSKLVFLQQPADGLNSIFRYQAMTPITVAVEDSNGNVDTAFNGQVTLGIESGPAGAVLGGTLTVNAVNGLVTFTFIAEATDGTYALDARSSGLATAVSASFSVTRISWIDEANMNVISGWAFDPNNTNATIDVEIDILGGPTQTIAADLDRPDITSVTGSADHGFTYTTPMLSTGSHTAFIYALLTDGSKVLIGAETLVSQNSLFDEHYYLEKYPNVAAAVAAGQFATGYDQYVKYGQYEGYSPSPFWNESWYLQQNPDVAAAVRAGKVSSGFMQYYLFGQYENRPGLLYFNQSYYLSKYPNVGAAIAAGIVTSAYEQYVDFGQYEGYSPMLYFSPAVYDADNQDIAPYVTGEPFTSDFEQFLEYGQFEGRVASNNYNERTYLADNADVAAAVEAGEFPDGFIQWLEYGQYEGRTAV
jgi:hypothetical protein